MPILEMGNISKDQVELVFPGIDPSRIFVDITDYTCFVNLFEIVKTTLNDPRRTTYGNVKHNYFEVITIIIICTIFGITKVKYIVDFAKKKIGEFRIFLKLVNGIAGYNAFLRYLQVTDIDEIAKCREMWIDSLTKLKNETAQEKLEYEGKKITIHAQDGKTITGSACDAQNSRPTHVVTNINTETGEVLAEVVVDKKSNEIKANPELIGTIPSLDGVLTTFDAMGCQRDLATAIDGKDGLYLFQVKGNQPSLEEEIKYTFENRHTDSEYMFCKNRNRYEYRRIFYSDDVKYLPSLREWPSVKAYGLIYNITVCDGIITYTTHMYIMNFNDKNLFVKSARTHWYVENNLHYIADTVYEEDKCKVRKKGAPAALNAIRKIGITIFSKISLILNKDYSVRRLVNFTRNSLSDLADLVSGNFNIFN